MNAFAEAASFWSERGFAFNAGTIKQVVHLPEIEQLFLFREFLLSLFLASLKLMLIRLHLDCTGQVAIHAHLFLYRQQLKCLLACQ